MAIMKQYRLSKADKEKLCAMYDEGMYTFKDLSDTFAISPTAIKGLLNRRGYIAKPQSELQRRYALNEGFFDYIGEVQAYFLGILYADGYNNTDRNTINLSLKESDIDILIRLNTEIGSNRPLQFINVKKYNDNSSNQYRLVISSKKVSDRVAELGCTKNKTFTITFPDYLTQETIRHFVRGYMDGDGCIMEMSVNFVGTLEFCEELATILRGIGIPNPYIRTRHKERNHNIRMIEVSGRRQCKILLDWVYKDSTIYMLRKFEKYQELLSTIIDIDTPRLCSITGCEKKHTGNGYCRNHYYEFCGGAQKRHERYVEHKV